MHPARDTPPPGQVRPSRRVRQQPAPVDLERLADKVYRLLLAELRLSSARGEPPLCER